MSTLFDTAVDGIFHGFLLGVGVGLAFLLFHVVHVSPGLCN